MVAPKPNTEENIRMAEPENWQNLGSQENLPFSRDYPPVEEREKSAADWKAYTLETLHALDV